MEMHEATEEVLSEFVEQLYMADVSTKTARRALHSAFPELDRWFLSVLRPSHSFNSKAETAKSPNNSSVVPEYGVRGVLDIEELVSSPNLGLKGKMDASVHFVSQNSPTSIGPLELKTGSSIGGAAVAHTAQVILYNLLMAERYRQPIKFGMITYLRYDKELLRSDSNLPSLIHEVPGPPSSKVQIPRDVSTRMVPIDRSSLVGLMMQRNRLALYLEPGSPYNHLPALLECGEPVCSKCFVNENCLVQHKLIERGSAHTIAKGPGETLFASVTAHLQPRDATYYNLWRKILQDEEQYSFESRGDIWNISAARRESSGYCFTNLKLNRCDVIGDMPARNDRRFLATFEHDKEGLLAGDQKALTAGDFVTVSGEIVSNRNNNCDNQLMMAISNGFLESLNANQMKVSVSKNLEDWCTKHNVQPREIVWTLHSESKLSSHTTPKDNLERLFCKEELSGLRDLIIGGKAPRFEELSANGGNATTLSLCNVLNLNSDQRRAVSWARRAKDYLLVLGMPGTGKSTTLAAIILSFVREGKSVLLCSYTNAAVDNVLLTLLRLNFTDFIRLGRKINAVDGRLHKYHERNIIDRNLRTKESLENVYNKPRLIASTCLGINHIMFQRRSAFDAVLIDEASQISQPTCIGPLRFSKGPFILVGDHYQLPPLMKVKGRNKANSEPTHIIAEGAASESLFRRLCNFHPEAIVSLRRQYRMRRELMDLSNHAVYSGNLLAGLGDTNEEQAALRPSRGPRDNGMSVLLDTYRHAYFLDTAVHCDSQVTTAHGRGAIQRKSKAECALAIEVVNIFLKDGMHCEDVTVLTSYKAQLGLICEELARNKLEIASFTIDQYQGKDNRIIIASLVDNEVGASGLLADWRRLNVLLTRAKEKLILIGNSLVFEKGGHVQKSVINYMRNKDMMIPVRLMSSDVVHTDVQSDTGNDTNCYPLHSSRYAHTPCCDTRSPVAAGTLTL